MRQTINFIEQIINVFGTDMPIFTDEIIDLFPNITRAYVFRLIKKAEEEGKLISFYRGIYYVPRKTFFGESSLCSESIAEKKYIKNGDSIYGIYSGLGLLNQFKITDQVPNTLEIVTNKEATRKRNIIIKDREFILRKSKCTITKDNFTIYTLLQLFNDLNKEDNINDFALSTIRKYINDNKISTNNIFDMSKYFSSITLKKMIGSGVLNGII